MTLLTIWADDAPATPLLQTSDPAAIAGEMDAIGVHFSRHDLVEVPVGTLQDGVIEAYRPLIDALVAEHGYTLIDVAQLHPSDDEAAQATAAAARLKFLNEHTHDEEEIRFFSQGSGVFYLHVQGKVFAMVCTAGDLLSVPANTTHWFDMGTRPDFTAIRFFHTDDGWVGNFTGSDISQSFPTFDELSALAHA